METFRGFQSLTILTKMEIFRRFQPPIILKKKKENFSQVSAANYYHKNKTFRRFQPLTILTKRKLFAAFSC